jgi:hypothetical protein
MTEAEWLGCEHPPTMLETLWKRSRATERKLRLLDCECCRHIWHLLNDPRSRRAVESAEQYTEGRIDRQMLERAAVEARAAIRHARPESDAAEFAAATAAMFAARAAAEAVSWDGLHRTSAAAAMAAGAVSSPDDWEPSKHSEEVWQSGVLRDIFGNPFRTVTVNPEWLSWNGGTIRKIAQASYDDRAFDRMPILADALEDAGCTDADILDHCRGAGPHVRGCWVVDLLLGKE